MTLVSFGAPSSALTVNPPTESAGVTPLGWGVVGLDSNNVLLGPDEFPIGARFCAPASATGVTAQWSWLPGGTTTTDANIRLADTSTAYETITVGALGAGNCFDAYWNVKLTRSVSTYDLSRAYQVTFRDGTGALLGSTDNRRRVYAEHLLSQERNAVGTVALVGGGDTLTAGLTYDFTVTGLTSSSYGQLSFASIFPAPTFQLLKADFSYSTPVGSVDQTYVDACAWVSMFDVAEEPGQCTSAGSAGGSIVGHFKVRVSPTASGVVGVKTLIYDYSGSSFHYNTDFNDAAKMYTISLAQPSRLTVSYFANAGTDTVTGTVPDSATVILGDTYTVLGGVDTRTDGTNAYAFVGWNTQADGTGNAYSVGTVLTPTANLSLYAMWVPTSKWELSYNTMGGLGGPDTTTVASTTESITVGAAVPTKLGYTFTFWSGLANGTGDTYTAGAQVATTGANTLKVLYAQYTANQVALTYHANGGTGADFVDTYTVGAYTIKTSAAVGFTRAGYVFTGWNTAANGTGTAYTAGFNYTGASLTDLYAQWLSVPVAQYTVTYLGNGNTSGASPFDGHLYLTTETATVLGSGTLARAGYTFAGWSYNSNGSGPLLQSGNVITLTVSDVVLYAVWTAVVTPPNATPTTYAVNVIIVGSGTVGPETRTFTGGSVDTLTATPATGWTFVGWTGDCTGTSLNCVLTMNANKTVTATFVQGVTVTTAVTGSGTVTTTVPVGTVVAPGTMATLTAVPAAGWQFASWTGGCTGTTNPITVTLDASKACTAVFTQSVVTPQAPTAADDRYAVRSGKVLRVGATAGVMANDGATITTVALVSKTKHGTVRLFADGSFIYTSKKGFHGADSFTYKASDAAAKSVNAVVRITVTKAPKVPTAIKTGR